jgi:excisionase family DNA binding protein
MTDQYPTLLTPGEVARIFQVDPKSVARWAKNGQLSSTRTLGGHRRFFEAEVLALLEASKRARKI